MASYMRSRILYAIGRGIIYRSITHFKPHDPVISQCPVSLGRASKFYTRHRSMT